jgi:hypothetical protein
MNNIKVLNEIEKLLQEYFNQTNINNPVGRKQLGLLFLKLDSLF